MGKFGYLWLLCCLIACDVKTSPSPEDICQKGYACVQVSVTTPESTLPQDKPMLTQVVRVSQILALADSEQKTVQGFAYEQGLLNLFQADRVWSYSQGEGIIVAVVDSGIDGRHESLNTQVVAGFDFIANTSQMQDPNGHGTAVAAIIAGNGIIKGLAPQAKILPLRVLDKHLQGSTRDVTRAILYAADLLPGLSNPYPAQVINLSLGSYGQVPSIYEAIKLVRQKGVVVIAASGNSGATLAYPAAYPEVIAVGAAYVTFGDWQREAYSSYGPGLDVVAPVGGVSKTQWGWFGEPAVLTALANSHDKTTEMSGTSVAAPQVAALAALLFSIGKTLEETESILLHSSSDILTIGWDEETGFGLMNPVAALRTATLSNESPIQIQFVDQGSQQELIFQAGQNVQSLQIPAGNYGMRVWQDHNHDHMWQSGEPCRWQILESLSGTLTLELELKAHCH